MERKKEQAKVLSQEMLADGIYSLWIETEAALTARNRRRGGKKRRMSRRVSAQKLTPA